MLAVAATALITGCTSKPINPAKAMAVPHQRLYSHQVEIEPGAKLVITKDSGYWASGGCTAQVLIDGKKAARMPYSRENVNLGRVRRQEPNIETTGQLLYS